MNSEEGPMERRNVKVTQQATKQPRLWRSLDAKREQDRTSALAHAAGETPSADVLSPGGLLRKVGLAGAVSEQAGASGQAGASEQSGQRSSSTQAAEEGAAGTAGLGRRDFMTWSSASAAWLGLQACVRRPEEKILPYTHAVEHALPGIPSHYATAISDGRETLGLLVETHQGRPTKVEGNPDHPESLGATDVWSQAELLNLYDADRAKQVRNKGQKASYEEFLVALDRQLKAHRSDEGRGLCLLLRPSSSPTEHRLREAVIGRFKKARVFEYSSQPQQNAREGALLAYDQALNVRYDLSKARVVAAFEAGLFDGLSGVRTSAEFAQQRRLSEPSQSMNRLYVAESSMSLAGASADHRLRVPASQLERLLLSLAKELVEVHQVAVEGVSRTGRGNPREGADRGWIAALAKDLVSARGEGAIVVGGPLSPHAHALGHALNAALGNLGQAVTLHPDALYGAEPEGLGELVAAFEEKQVETLLILGGDPCYEAPGDVNLAERIKKVPFSMCLSSHVGQTARFTSWHVPQAHPFEAWGDAVTTNGIASVQQPLIAPLFGGKSCMQMLSILAGEGETAAQSLVRKTWTRLLPPDPAGLTWRRILQRGAAEVPLPGFGLSGVAVEAESAKLPKAEQSAGGARAKANAGSAPSSGGRRSMPRLYDVGMSTAVGGILSKPMPTPSADTLEVTVRLDHRLGDGRYANNPWLLELPDPLTRICWDNAAVLSPKTAAALGVKSGDMIQLSTEGRDVDIAAVVMPGPADFSIAVTMGWGQKTGQYAKGHGFNVNPLRSLKNPYILTGVKARPLGRTYPLAQTQEHHQMRDPNLEDEDRPIALQADLAEYKNDRFFTRFSSVEPSVGPLWKEVEYKGHKWGMTIDLSACTGCSACVVACQSENNVPVVGKEQVSAGREMHWLRVDRYFIGDEENDPEAIFQPVACVHCENAPCENVCPVNATEHSPEGLNDMAYNRCIGTRYCMNNCPYKVRRFNYLDYHGEIPEPKKMQFNPNVTVRMRGVMEKCTYCVQRIETARIESKRERRPLRDGDIVTACQQACPTQAIVFGDLNDPNSRVKKLTDVDRSYKLLVDIGTKPRTSYLARIKNANEEVGSDA